MGSFRNYYFPKSRNLTTLLDNSYLPDARFSREPKSYLIWLMNGKGWSDLDFNRWRRAGDQRQALQSVRLNPHRLNSRFYPRLIIGSFKRGGTVFAATVQLVLTWRVTCGFETHRTRHFFCSSHENFARKSPTFVFVNFWLFLGTDEENFWQIFISTLFQRKNWLDWKNLLKSK